MSILSKKPQGKAQIRSSTATTVYAGMDRSAYPGQTEMQDLFSNTNMWFTGFYLGGTDTIAGPCCHSSSSWMPPSDPSSVRSALKSQGWGFLPIYVGQQDDDSECPSCSNLTSAQGTADGQNAAALMQAAGFPTLAVVFLDIELGGLLPSGFVDYVSAWVAEVNNNTGYWAGVYCSYDQTAQQISNAVGASNVTIWTFDLSIQGCVTNTPFPTPAPDVAYSAAKSLQYAQGCNISNGVVTINNVDLDSSYSTDPSSNPTQA